MKTDVRIIRRTFPFGGFRYVIQTRGFLSGWKDAPPKPAYGMDRNGFDTAAEADRHTWIFLGTPVCESVVVTRLTKV